MFVSHVDTVHRDDGVNAIKQTPSVWYASGSQLGADDGAGTAMLMHLLYHKVPAYYIFTVGEECGGIGAKVVSDDQALLKQFDRAIAFDRRNNSSVITHQGYGRCCSDAFAEALSDKFNDAGLLYMPDDGGVYTDTAEFVDVIPECTNISIGYMAEHTDREALDILHFRHLADAVLSFDWDNLPTERDPSVDDFASGKNWWSSSLWGYGGAKFDDSYSWLKEDYPTQATGTYPATDTSTTWTDDDDLYCALEEAANRHDTGYLWSLLSDHIETYYGVTLPLSATINFKRADLHRWQKQVGQQPTEDILDEIAEQLTII